MKAEDFLPSDGADDSPVLNRMIEDYLAHGGSEADHAMLLKAWMHLGAEYMARATGRRYTMDSLENLREVVRTAQPATPWKP